MTDKKNEKALEFEDRLHDLIGEYVNIISPNTIVEVVIRKLYHLRDALAAAKKIMVARRAHENN
jgi:hypothetical protein